MPTPTAIPIPDPIPRGESLYDALDYGYTFWPTNFEPWNGGGVKSTVRYVQTGRYGLAFDVSKASVVKLGALSSGSAAEEALVQSASVIGTLPTASVEYEVMVGGQRSVATSFLSSTGDASNPSQLIDGGRFMQRLEIPQVLYGGDSTAIGRVRLAAMPRHFVLTHQVSHSRVDPTSVSVALTLRGEALLAFPLTEWLEGSRGVSIHDGAGMGWTFILPEDAGISVSVTRPTSDSLRFERSVTQLASGNVLTCPVIALPFFPGYADARELWLHPQTAVMVQFAQLLRNGTPAKALASASWEHERGLYLVPLGNMTDIGGGSAPNWQVESEHTFYNRHKVVVNNLSTEPVSVPLAFDGGKNATYSITGTSAFLRDEQGEPIGIPVQISKNWHEQPYWFHFYTSLWVPPGTHTFELTLVPSHWGEVYGVSHAQLCLIGWGTNQQWDEAALGGWGESITFDPDLTLKRAMIDDVRPFLVNTAGEYAWTGNVGGGDTLVYVNASGTRHRLSRLRTLYAVPGPNLTRVHYAGISTDGKIEGEVIAQLGRTDDLTRVTYQLRFQFLEDVPYQRLAFFQLAADSYGDNGFQYYAMGTENGIVKEGTIPTSGASGYASSAERGIPLEGRAPWVMLYSSTLTTGSLPEYLANIGFVVRGFEAQVGDQRITTPHLNIVHTNNKYHQVAFELGLPYVPGGLMVPAGSTITATIEQLVPPSVQSSYYGESPYLLALDSAVFQSPDMLQLLAVGGMLDAYVEHGRLLRTYPVEVEAGDARFATGASPGTVEVAALSLEGGLGFVPLTFSGLPCPEGWRLEVLSQGQWWPFTQEVEGQDFWQAELDPVRQTWSLTFSVPGGTLQHYRLVR